jgi:hypothetical protein
MKTMAGWARTTLLRCALLLGACPAFAGELEVRYTRLVGSGDPIPGTPPGTVFAAVSGAQPAGDHVVFYGQNDSGSVRGYYLHDGNQVQRVLDTTTILTLPGVPQVPSSQIYFDFLTMPIHTNGSGLVASVISTEHPGHVNAYWAIQAWADGVVHPIAAKGQQPPGGPPGSRFMTFGAPRVRGSAVFFLATREGMLPDTGYYRWVAGDLHEVALGDLNVINPAPTEGGLCATAFDPHAAGYPYGIWCHEDGEPEPAQVLDFGSLFPGGSGVWLGVANGRLVPLEDQLLWAARSSGNDASGLYRIWYDSVEPVLTNIDTDPVTGLPFTLWPWYAGAGQRVAFTGYDPADFLARLRLQDEDRLFHKLVDVGDVFEGQTVDWINLHFGGFSGNRLAFSLYRSNDSAVWLADFGPEPPPGPGGGPSVLEVPTLGQGARFALALMLALAAVRLLAAPGRKQHRS